MVCNTPKYKIIFQTNLAYSSNSHVKPSKLIRFDKVYSDFPQMPKELEELFR